MRSLDEALNFLSSFTDWEQLLHKAPARTTFDLGRLERLLQRFDAPHRGRPVAHVTGTKGKSSVVMMTDALLLGHGLQTFRFLSPHVIHVTERLAVNGTDIADDTFVDLVRRLRPEIEAIRDSRPEDLPSFFEAMTVMGFLCARDSDVDALVLEVGLGGRLDATNVVDPAVAVVTSVALDHTRILGDTVEKIAVEKAGILKPGRPAVTGLTPDHAGFAVVAKRAADLGCPLAYPGNGLHVHRCEETVDDQGTPLVRFDARVGSTEFEGLRLVAGARHQADNAVCAIAAATAVLEARGASIDVDVVRDTLARLRLRGRCQYFPGEVPALIDGAHTTESVADLVRTARRIAAGRPVHLLCGLTRDRTPDDVLGQAVAMAASVTTTELPTPRSLPATDVLGGLTLARDGAALPRPDEAWERAVRRARADGGMVLVTGSLYLAGEILKRVR